MGLQSSGSISLNDVAGEFGGSAAHSLSEYYAAADGIPASGQISLSDFYGKSASLWIPSTSDINVNGLHGSMASSSSRTIAGNTQDYMLYTDNNGVTWTPVFQSYKLGSVTYGNGQFVAAGFGSEYCYTSTTGLAWTPAFSTPYPANASGSKIKYPTSIATIPNYGGYGQKIIVCDSSGMMAHGWTNSYFSQATIFSSTTNVSWDKICMHPTNGTGIVSVDPQSFNSGIWYTTSSGTQWVMTTPTLAADHFKWTARNSDNNRFYCLTYYSDYSTRAPRMWIMDPYPGSGQSWGGGTTYTTNLPAGAVTRGLVYNAYDNHFYTKISTDYDNMYKSTDGITWTAENLPATSGGDMIHYTGSSVQLLQSFGKNQNYPDQSLYKPN